MKKVLLVLFLISASFFCRAQQWAVSTNVLDYANFGTLNIEGSVAVSRHLVVDVMARYNPWEFRKDTDSPIVNKKRMFAAGIKVYPWFSYDGWFISASAGWMEYAAGGIINRNREEGDAFMGALGGGYTLLLHRNLNLDFGVDCWLGSSKYVQYDGLCRCGEKIASGNKFVVMPHATIGLTWIFGN